MAEKLNKENNCSVIDFSGRYINILSKIFNNYYNRNLNETSEDLMQLFLNCTEVIELDLSNNMLTKLPLEISFLTCLTKLDIRNNAFSSVKNIYIINIIIFYSLKIQ